MKKQVSVFLLSILIFSGLFLLLQYVYSMYFPNTPLMDLIVLMITVLVFLPFSYIVAKKLVNKTMS